MSRVTGTIANATAFKARPAANLSAAVDEWSTTNGKPQQARTALAVARRVSELSRLMPDGSLAFSETVPHNFLADALSFDEASGEVYDWNDFVLHGIGKAFDDCQLHREMN